MKLKYTVSGYLLFVAVVLSIAWYADRRDADPLTKLDATARSFDVRESSYRPPLTNVHYWDVLELQGTLEMFEVGVEFSADVPAGVAGLTYPSRDIVIDAALSWDARLETLGHEAGHTMHMHIPLTWAEGEVFAEAVGYLIAASYNHDALDSSARYLSRHKAALHILKDYRTEILYAAGVLGAPSGSR